MTPDQYYQPRGMEEWEHCPDHEGQREEDCYEPHCLNCHAPDDVRDCPECGARYCPDCWLQVGQCGECGHSPVMSIEEAMHAYRSAALDFLNGGK